MKIQELLAPFRRAINDYSMISDNDYIGVGVSGGKDSLVLLALLAAYRKFSPQKFDLCAVTIDMGFRSSDFSPVARYCEELGVEYHVEKTDIAEILFEIKKEKNPCSLCSKMRRGALNNCLLKKGVRKLALGHHADDVAETFLLSLLYEGRLSTFSPVSYMDKTGVTLIRPMIYIREKNIGAYAKQLPVVFNPCPADKHTRREYMKKLLSEFSDEIPFAEQRIIDAVTHPERNNLWPAPSHISGEGSRKTKK